MTDDVAEKTQGVQVSEPPRYKVMQDTFIAPWYIKAGTIIDFNGEPGGHLEPVNEAAKIMMDAYYKHKPEARIRPIDDLPITPGAATEPQFAVVGQAAPDDVISFVDMAERAGYAKEPAKVVSLAEAQARGVG